MRSRLLALAAITLCASSVFAFSDDAAQTAFTGQISDSICARAGSHDDAMRMNKFMGNTAASCSTACVDAMGAKFVLFNPKTKKIYRLSDQAAARKFAGQNVKVTGSLKKNEIAVTSIVPQ
jgi:hypothetical protein